MEIEKNKLRWEFCVRITISLKSSPFDFLKLLGIITLFMLVHSRFLCERKRRRERER